MPLRCRDRSKGSSPGPFRPIPGKTLRDGQAPSSRKSYERPEKPRRPARSAERRRIGHGLLHWALVDHGHLRMDAVMAGPAAARAPRARRARIREGLLVAGVQLALLPFMTDRISGWFLRVAAELTGFAR